MKILNKSFSLVLIAFVVTIIESCQVKNLLPAKTVAKDVSLIKVALQERKTFDFANEGVSFSNDFSSGRLNQLTKIDESTYRIDIMPENTPINPSPWFAFKVWGVVDKKVNIILNYPTAKHRYLPKISTDGLTWQTLDSVELSPDKKQASFKIQLTKDTLTVAAQEINSAAQGYGWMDSLAATNRLKTEVVGYTIGGKPMVALSSTRSNGKKLVVILSRQHPPEVSGYMAMKPFVETLLANTSFLKEYELVVFPLMNPDGVDEGNWRHNLGGVDLNRDWTDFKQPETRSVRDYLLGKLKKQDARVIFALDFHSTFFDILYTNTEDQHTHRQGLVQAWIAGLHRLDGDIKTRVEASSNKDNLSKGWLGRVLNAEVLIYEVGDNTPRAHIREKAVKTAGVLIDVLMSDK